MSIKILLEDQIDKLFKDNSDLEHVNKNRFEIAVSAFANLNFLNGIDFDDLIDGIMGDGGDEGIDMCYIFCNGSLIKDENINITKDSNIKVKFFQVKKEDSFSTDGFRKLKEGIEEVFNLDLELNKLQVIGANKDIVEIAQLIRAIFRKSRVERAKFSCEVFYATASATIDISTKINHLENELKQNSLSIPFEFNYWGAQKLIDLNQKIEELIEIKFHSQPLNISEKEIATSGFAGFVNGNELMKSLIDENNDFKSHLTEGNVRFFLGEDKKINSSIIDSALDLQKASIFWALNNGLTIIGDSISPLDSRGYSISNPQIVNGCQTIHCLYHAYMESEQKKLPDSLKVFVKLVKTDNTDIQTDIISATNSQNPVKSASLKANDSIQRNIEFYLGEVGIYYERRANFYKRQGITGNRVVGLLKLAQIMHSIVNKESISAVNDTSTIFDSESKYNSIFNDKADYDLYKFSTILHQKIWSTKNSDLRLVNYPSDKKELIAKGGFVFLNIISTLMFSDARFLKKGLSVKETMTDKFSIDTPARKNAFSIRKVWLFQKLEDSKAMDRYYFLAKKILNNAANDYKTTTGKTKSSLFKYRAFDKDYLKPAIDLYFKKIS